LGQLFKELKRRNVFRVAVAYLVSGWLVLQVAELVLDSTGAPDWVMKVLLLIGLLGFPFVLVFSWAYELTPEGLKKEKEVDRSASITPETGRKLNIITIGMLVLVLAVVVIERTVMRPEPAPVTVTTAPVTQAAEKSIAVLAFEDLSPEGDQEYFADGLSEELLNVLAKVSELKVAGRTSSFAFKGTTKDLREIGELLNVAHILEGSVRKAGNRIRVTAQLIKADDGFHLFSETYDRDLEDIFAVQDEIAQEISKALLTEIVGTEIVARSQTDTEAYELYLLARQRIHTRDIFNLREADSMLDRVLEIDSLFAPALAQKALVMHLMSDSLGAYGDIPMAETMPVARRAIDQALALDATLAEAHAINGLLLDNLNQVDEAIVALERARDLNPTLSDAANWLSSSYAAIGRQDDAVLVLEEAVERDPTYGPAFNNLIAAYTRTSRFDDADALLARVERIVGDNDDIRMARGIIGVMRGEPAAAARYLRSSLDLNPNSSINKMWYGFALMMLADFETLANVGLREHRIIAYAEQGYVEKALEEVEKFDFSIAFVPRAVSEIGSALISNGEVNTYLTLIEDHFGTAADLLAKHPVSQGWSTEYIAEMVWAYRQVGDEETAEMLVNESSRIIESFGDDVQGNWAYTDSVARHGAITGDDELALRALRQSLDNGMLLLIEIDSPLFAHLRDDERFQAIRADMLIKVDEQRAILGMPPYRPVQPTEDRPAFVN
jgi:TolB-like protein/Flp pilus assembly protein TadD